MLLNVLVLLLVLLLALVDGGKKAIGSTALEPFVEPGAGGVTATDKNGSTALDLEGTAAAG